MSYPSRRGSEAKFPKEFPNFNGPIAITLSTYFDICRTKIKKFPVFKFKRSGYQGNLSVVTANQARDNFSYLAQGEFFSKSLSLAFQYLAHTRW